MGNLRSAKYLRAVRARLKPQLQGSNLLAGVTTPAYIKRGHRVIYDEEDLLAWTAQFRKITNTSQSSIDQRS